jgi:hypothetical protein
VLVVVASFSRFITARMVPTRTAPDLLAGMWSLLSEQLGAIVGVRPHVSFVVRPDVSVSTG